MGYLLKNSEKWIYNDGSDNGLKIDSSYFTLENRSLKVLGDFYISGTTTTVNTDNMNIKDNIILLNSGETGSGVTQTIAGIEIDRGYYDNYRFVFDENSEIFRIGKSGSTNLQAVATRNDSMSNSGISFWDDNSFKIVNVSYFTYNSATTDLKTSNNGDFFINRLDDTDSNNNGVGYQSLSSNTTGHDNTAFGYQSLLNNTSGYRNMCVGYRSLYSNTTGYNNTAFGYQTSYFNTVGHDNIGFSYRTLYYNTTGHNNTSFGYQSLFHNTEGDYNIGVGYQTLYYNTSGNKNISIGYYVGPTGTTTQFSNKLYIDIKNSGDSSFIYGEMDDTNDNGRLNINSILKLRSRTSFPTSPTPDEGDLVRLKDHSSLSDGYYVYNGSNWISIIQW